MTLPDRDDFDTFGGEKKDYHPVEDPSTDRSAGEVNSAFADTAMMSRMALRAYVMFTTHAATPTVDQHEALWGNSNGVKPVVTVISTGVYDITWPATVSDPLNVSHSINFLTGWGEVDAQSAFAHTHVTRMSANVLRVKILNSSHAADGTAGLKVKVFGL